MQSSCVCEWQGIDLVNTVSAIGNFTFCIGISLVKKVWVTTQTKILTPYIFLHISYCICTYLFQKESNKQPQFSLKSQLIPNASITSSSSSLPLSILSIILCLKSFSLTSCSPSLLPLWWPKQLIIWVQKPSLEKGCWENMEQQD